MDGNEVDRPSSWFHSPFSSSNRLMGRRRLSAMCATLMIMLMLAMMMMDMPDFVDPQMDTFKTNEMVSQPPSPLLIGSSNSIPNTMGESQQTNTMNNPILNDYLDKPAYSLTYSGNYCLKIDKNAIPAFGSSPKNQVNSVDIDGGLRPTHVFESHTSQHVSDTDTQRIVEIGGVSITIFNRHSILNWVRISDLKLSFVNGYTYKKYHIHLTGMEMHNIGETVLVGHMPPPDFVTSKSPKDTCFVTTVIRLHEKDGESISYQPIDPSDIFYYWNTKSDDRFSWTKRRLEGVKGNKLISKSIADGPQHRDFEARLVSDDCQFRIDISANELDLGVLTASIIRFSFFFNLKVIWEMRLFVSQISRLNHVSSGTRISLGSLSMHVIVDAFEALFMLFAGLRSGIMMSSFVSMAVFKILLICMMEMRYFTQIWKAHYRTDLSSNVDLLRQQTGIVLRKFSIIVFIALFVLFRVFPYVPSIIVPFYLVWVPQIFWDAWQGMRKSVHFSFLIGTTLSRLPLPLYLFLVPPSYSIFHENLISLPPNLYPNSGLMWSIIVISLGQILVYFCQALFGSRFLFPSSWFPHIYDYHRIVAADIIKLKKDDMESNVEAVECVICMSDITLSDRATVITPCDHYFHELCLKQWLNVKMECPTCRGILPPLITDYG